jgi:hypothetical protein
MLKRKMRISTYVEGDDLNKAMGQYTEWLDDQV